ncbi:ExeM/NucH family extracellular endonuclease [Loktanella sp. R86503]|uniref:ExeM/NucH family extracellular endonuclease n=1 Tax=Loktanella sp. R86503 TaxID=3093847 RepID=UPI0036DCD25B
MAKAFKIGFFFGGFGPDVIDGTASNDVIFGGFDNDIIDAGAGRDLVFGGFGNDTILGAAGSDTIFGGAGTDTAIYEGGVENYTISFKPARGFSAAQAKITDGAGDTDTLRSVERLYFAADDYTADLTGGNNAVLARGDAASVAANVGTVLTGLDDNDFDFDGDNLQISGIDTSDLTGTATLQPDGTISYDAAGAFDHLAEGEVATTTLRYTVTDGRGSVDTATVTITVTGVNDAPTLDLTDVMVFENSTAVLTATGADVDGDLLTYTISGADAALFVIDPATGEVAFADNPDFEAPVDQDGDNVYQIAITATDTGGLSATSDIAVTVTDVEDTAQPSVFVNEIHYDNAGADTGEFIEVAGAAGTDLTGWSLVLYNGNGGASYATIRLDGGLSGTSGQGYFSVDAVGIQNGSPDGVALVDASGAVVEFLSYEGEMTATNGPAAGMTSVDIGVSENGSDAAGLSLQRQEDGSWTGPVTATRDAANDDDTDTPPPLPDGTTLISTVQGSGSASAYVGQTVSVTAVVTMVAENGFYIQEEDSDADGNAATSEGIFVFTGDTPNVTVSYGVTVVGEVSEYFNATQINAQTFELVGPLAQLPTAAELSLPFATDDALEAVEGMRVSLDIGTEDAPLQVIETFELGRYGEIVVSEGAQYQPTQIYDAQTQASEISALQAANAANRLTIDDGVAAQNPTGFAYIPNTTDGDNGNGYLDIGDDLSAGGTLRIGAEITAPVTGVMSYSFGEYKLIADGVLQIDEATNNGAREAAPADVGGTLQVASVNTLNYFTTLGQDDSNARGAQTAEDFARQTDKLVTAITALDSDIIGLQELENNGFGDASAIATLVDALNTRAGSAVYAFVDPTGTGGLIGTDAITTGLIYRTDAVSVVNSGILDYTPEGESQQNRPTVAALFEDTNGEQITIAVNHFKSKGGSGTGDDADLGDGQGAFNGTRTDAAIQLTQWLASDPFGSGDTDYLIIGDLNAYGAEDPVQAIEDAGYTSLLSSLIGEDAFSYTFDGQRGALDQALASSSLTGQVTGITEWHINSLEPSILGYSSEFTDPAWFNGDDPYSASDHDPLLIGLDLGNYMDLQVA